MDLLLKTQIFLYTHIFDWSSFWVFPAKENANSSIKQNIRQLEGADETNRCSLKADTTQTYDSSFKCKPRLQLLFLIVREAYTPSSSSRTHIASAHLTLLKKSWTHQLTDSSTHISILRPCCSLAGQKVTIFHFMNISWSLNSHTIKTVHLSCFYWVLLIWPLFLFFKI